MKHEFIGAAPAAAITYTIAIIIQTIQQGIMKAVTIDVVLGLMMAFMVIASTYSKLEDMKKATSMTCPECMEGKIKEYTAESKSEDRSLAYWEWECTECGNNEGTIQYR